jgi:hypothetical protein
MEDILLDKNRGPRTQSNCNGITGPGIDGDLVFLGLEIDETIISVFLEIVDDYMTNLAIKDVNEIADEIMGQRSMGRGFFQLKGYGVGFEWADPNGKGMLIFQIRQKDHKPV